MNTSAGNHSLAGETLILDISSPLTQVTTLPVKSSHARAIPGRWSDIWGIKFSDDSGLILGKTPEGWTESALEVISTTVRSHFLPPSSCLNASLRRIPEDGNTLLTSITVIGIQRMDLKVRSR
jgi:hypothetical protein